MSRRRATVLGGVTAMGLAVAGMALLSPWDAGVVASPGLAATTGSTPSTGSAAGTGTVAAAATLDGDGAATGALAEALSGSRATPAVAAAPTPPPLAPLGGEVAVTYHAQQDPDWCDPADIEMWLQADGIPLPASDDYDVQQAFWSYETDNNDGYTISEWNASPYAVAVTLDDYGGWSDIGDAPQPSADAAGVVISNSLAVQHQPVIVMVGGGTHYVLVTGVTLSSSGADAPPVQVKVANPLAFGVGGSPPAGSDGTRTMSWNDFTAWYTANTAHGGVWSGQWVLIAQGIPLVG
ncbi:MAG TPA: hypothetical protein VEK76_06495 [Candidatus Binatia bacterium]|nr:hypothetical protein [Candidatus Binatia bacterium]